MFCIGNGYYIVVGGGIAGSVVSSRLLEQNPSSKILLIEAGPDVSNRTDIVYINSTNLIMGDFDYNYQTVPQANLGNRQIANPSGRALGGGFVINSGGWTRGSSLDYDLWADTVGDQGWSYSGQLPYFRKSEDHCDSKHPDQHGHGGPIHVASVTCTGRNYPLRDKVLDSWHEAGVDSLPDLDGNAGRILGVGELYENRRDGKRQIASSAYSLEGVTVLTETLMESITLTKGDDGSTQATGLRLANGTEYRAKRVVASAGAYRTPQLLLLSGIGPSETLAQRGIEKKVDLPDVGQNLADHVVLINLWRLKDPSHGYALGSGNPLFDEPQFGLGNANDFVTKGEAAHNPVTHSSPKSDDQVADMENFITYVPAPSTDPAVPVDDTHISTSLASLCSPS
ncbi:hypothetical protein PG994_004298 [Apiospora phragmitis]|uniref:Glucose-methanol-choline oxidoreductase N-terminal domain-containing protein n=1 Tax=Apiospora phragmitis TaxID=2905665 RepID=A0ABR1VU23_9PEZI